MKKLIILFTYLMAGMILQLSYATNAYSIEVNKSIDDVNYSFEYDISEYFAHLENVDQRIDEIKNYYDPERDSCSFTMSGYYVDDSGKKHEFELDVTVYDQTCSELIIEIIKNLRKV